MDVDLGIPNVWGKRLGSCTWCDKPACLEYRDKDLQGEIMDYQVCESCYKERASK